MANEFQNSIFKAIDTLLDKRVENLALDKTITATIDMCVNMIDNIYTINYQGGKTYAYAQAGATYTKDQEVYVLVPEGNFTKKKIIMGVASTISKDNSSANISSVISDYNIIGGNLLNDKKLRQGLHSYMKYDGIELYDHAKPVDENLIDVKLDDLEVYLKDADAITIRAAFNTADLPKEHRQSQKGNFGIVFNMLFKDASSYPLDDNEVNDKNLSQYTKNVAYVLDTSNMTGNPFVYMNDTVQYETYPFDSDNFIRIESIYAFCQDFVKQDNDEMLKVYGADIFIKNFELFGLKQITSEQDGYRLRISTPKGSIFKDEYPAQYILDVKAELSKDGVVIDGASYHWFREDARVDRTSAHFNSLGGAGWYYLKDDEATLTNVYSSMKKNNHAYENNYLCVMDYQNKLFLKSEFTLYNDSNRREIAIDASPAAKFSFDNGNVELTCKVRLKEGDEFIDDFSKEFYKNYSFVWTRIDPKNGNIIFNQTPEEIDKLIEDSKDMREKLNLRNKKTSYAGATWNKNRLTYPVSSIDKRATFKCSVYVSEYLVGSATITIENEDVADPTDYYIIIENGDQVFQYSESGVSPCDERYKDPLEVFNLKCHFIDPAGLKVDPETYSIKWKFPLEDTMLVVPKVNDKGVAVNPANERAEWLYSLEYPTKIADNYDYQALNNQIEAIVLYHGVEYTKSTDFLFVKIGDNGTNGTDIIAKLDIVNQGDKDLRYIKCVKQSDGSWKTHWDDNADKTKRQLVATLYQRNVKIPYDENLTISCDVLGKQTYSKFIEITDDNATKPSYFVSANWPGKQGNKYIANNIVQATFKYGGNNYYACHNIPILEVLDPEYSVTIDKRRTLKDILYNADGRNPLYNKNQGVCFNLLRNGEVVEDSIAIGQNTLSVKVLCNTIGGTSDTHNGADLDIIVDKNSKDVVKYWKEKDPFNVVYNKEESARIAYILPKDVYNGASCNNNVVLYCYVGDVNVCNLYVPIYMSLNRYGLASLNAWDGNHVEINEDDNYIMAPQIGAGSKDTSNRFTGVVMGTAQTYDQENSQIGLLGYSAGEQSIFLNSENGSAIFGFQPTDVRAEPVKILDENKKEVEKPEETLSEPVRPRAPGSEATEEEKQEYEVAKAKYESDLNAYRQNVADWENYWNYYYLAHENAENAGRYRYSEGRIELIPNGTSKIGNWRIGSTMLYNVMGANDKGEQNELDKPYSDLRRANQKVSTEEELYKRSIPHQESGILISSAPTYMSIKGHRLQDKVKWVFTGDSEKESDLNNQDKYVETYPEDSPGDIDSTSGNAILYDGDSFELELNPNARSLFTIYRHSQNDDDWSNSHWGIPSNVVNKSVPWFRRAMVGIDNAGRFYTNSIKEEGAALTLNYLPAFGQVATTNFYRGVNIEIGKENDDTVPLIKFFGERSILEKNLDSATVYISGGSRTNNEYIRPLSVHGKSIALYAEPDSSKMRTKKMTGHRLRLTNKWAVFGHYTTDDNGAPSSQNQDSFISCLELTTENNAYSTLWSKSHLRIHSGENFTHTVGGNSTTSISGTTTATFNKTTSITSIDNMTVTVGKDTTTSRKNFKLNTYDYHLNLIHNTGFALGSDTNYLKLKDSGTKEMKLRIAGANSYLRVVGINSDVEILSRNSPIHLQSYFSSNNDINESYSVSMKYGYASISLAPQDVPDINVSSVKRTGHIHLLTDGGQIDVGGALGNDPNLTSVNITPCIGTNYQYISDKFPREDRDDKPIHWDWREGKSLVTKYGIHIETADAMLQINNTGINEKWLQDIQNLYNHWRKNPESEYYPNFPRTDSEITGVIENAGFAKSVNTVTKKDVQENIDIKYGNQTYSGVNSALDTMWSFISNPYEPGTIAYQLDSLEKRVKALEDKNP